MIPADEARDLAWRSYKPSQPFLSGREAVDLFQPLLALLLAFIAFALSAVCLSRRFEAQNN